MRRWLCCGLAIASGRDELRAILQPYALASPWGGVVESSLKEQSPVARGTLLVGCGKPTTLMKKSVRLFLGDSNESLCQSGSTIAAGDTLLTLTSDEESIWEALRGLSLIGDNDDLPAIEQYERGAAPGPARSDRIKEQAALTAKAIKSRFGEAK